MGCAEGTAACVSKEEQVVTGDGGLAVLGPQMREHRKSEFGSKYSLGKSLGQGSYGEVRRAERRSTGQAFAVKVLELETGRGRSSSHGTPAASSRRDAAAQSGRLGSPRMSMAGGPPQRSQSTRSTGPPGGLPGVDYCDRLRKAALSEIAMLKAVGQHPHCLQLHEFFLEEGKCFLVTELCQEGNLLEHLNRAPLPSLGQLQRVMRGMARGVARAHEMRVVHRDIKPENFLVGGEDGKTIKLADFGSATALPRDESAINGVVGTAPYMSPEMIGDAGYDESTDVWSLGATYYVVLFCEYPYGSKESRPGRMKAAIFFGKDEPTFKKAAGKKGPFQVLPEGALELTRSCLQRPAWLRPSASKVLQHTFLRSGQGEEKPAAALGGPGSRRSSSSDMGSAQAAWSGSDISTGLPSEMSSRHGSKCTLADGSRRGSHSGSRLGANA